MGDNPAEIKMYSTEWCPDCHRAKKFLGDKGIDFVEINIEQNPEAAQLVMEMNEGKRRVPTFDIGGKFYGNPPISELAKIVA